jgi:hypothetical protein
MKYLDLISDMNESESDTTTAPTSVPISGPGPKPVGFPTVIDPNTGKWITDPEWIKENGLKAMRDSK